MSKLVAMLLLASLGGCVWVERDLSNPQTGQTETCTLGPTWSDILPLGPEHPYCTCMVSHTRAGFVPVGQPRLLNLCADQPDG